MIIRKLSDDERSALEEGLALAAKLVDGEPPLSTVQVQELYNALLTDHPGYAEGVIVAGLAFGELIAVEGGYEWVRVGDEYGEETMLSPCGTQIVCAPISMIQKRIAASEAINIAELRDETIKMLQRQIDGGDYRKR